MEPRKNIRVEYYISHGQGVKMYTLWVHRDNSSECDEARKNSPTGNNDTIRYWSYDKYLRNLSTDYDQAIEKACEITGLTADQIQICTDRELKDIVRGDDVIRFGKHCDKRVTDIEDTKWLNWLAKGAYVPDRNPRNNGGYVQLNPVRENPMLIELAIDRLIQLGDWGEFRGKKMSTKKIDLLNQGKQFGEELKFGHHFNNGERIKELTVFELSSFSFDTAYGTSYVVTFIDEEKRVYTYKGSSFFWYNIDTVLDEDQTEAPDHVTKYKYIYYKLKLQFTVEHSAYNDLPQTLLRRPKVIGKVAISMEEGDKLKDLYKNFKQLAKL